MTAGMGNKDVPGGWAGSPQRPWSAQHWQHICGMAAGRNEQNPPSLHKKEIV